MPPDTPSPPQWRAADFSELERRLTEAKRLLEQAARMMEAREMEKVSAVAELHLDQARRRHDHTIGRRYR